MNAFTDRRTMLRGLSALTTGAAASVASIPAIAAAEPPDPVFAAIEALNAATGHIDDLRDTGDHVAYEEACNAEGAAFDALTETPPTTLPGMRALLVFLHEWLGGNNGDYFDYSLLLRSPLLACPEQSGIYKV
jgi:hypothetical protein